jgi:hypothetical protein
MRRNVFFWTLCWLIAFSVGCASERFTPEPIHPSRERILQLAELSTPLHHPPVSELAIRIYPSFILAGQAIRVTCFVPDKREYKAVQYGVPGLQFAGRRAGSTSYERLIENVSCGEWIAVCLTTDNDGKVLAQREQAFTARGMCNDGG